MEGGWLCIVANALRVRNPVRKGIAAGLADVSSLSASIKTSTTRRVIGLPIIGAGVGGFSANGERNPWIEEIMIYPHRSNPTTVTGNPRMPRITQLIFLGLFFIFTIVFTFFLNLLPERVDGISISLKFV